MAEVFMVAIVTVVYANKLFENRLAESGSTQALFVHKYFRPGIKPDGLHYRDCAG